MESKWLAAFVREIRNKQSRILLHGSDPLAHNHLVSGNHISHFQAPPNQALRMRVAVGVLGRLLACALCAVPLLTPVSRVISAQEHPWRRSDAIMEVSTATLGRPMRFPFALAAAIPLRTLSRISSRSNSAILAKMPNTSRPFGVPVSTPSWIEMKSIPSERNSSRALTS